MSQLAVITFDHPEEAREARQILGRLERQGQFKVVDTAVITKQNDGTLCVDNELESSPKAGALIGGLLGTLLFFIFPLGGWCWARSAERWWASRWSRALIKGPWR